VKTRYKITFPGETSTAVRSPQGAGAAPSCHRYVYGDDHPLLKDPGVTVENAGCYDPETNDCDFTEPTDYFEGRIAPGK
jgi:hypothetical protein